MWLLSVIEGDRAEPVVFVSGVPSTLRAGLARETGAFSLAGLLLACRIRVANRLGFGFGFCFEWHDRFFGRCFCVRLTTRFDRFVGRQRNRNQHKAKGRTLRWNSLGEG